MFETEKLDLRVSGVDFTYNQEEGVDVVRLRFNVTDPVGDINANGRVAVTTEEYFNAQGFAALSDLARAKLVARLEGPSENE